MDATGPKYSALGAEPCFPRKYGRSERQEFVLTETLEILNRMSASPLNIVFLISGGGRTMLNVAGLIGQGKLPARISLVIGSNSSASGLAKAGELGIATAVIRPKDFASVQAFSEAVWERIRGRKADLVCMGGFLSYLLIPPDFANRVMNIHPSLLPAFGGRGMYGHHVHEAVIAAGARESGCTVHFVDNEYDHGPVVLQRRCAVLEGDTPESLAARVFEEELLAYPEAIRMFAAERALG